MGYLISQRAWALPAERSISRSVREFLRRWINRKLSCGDGLREKFSHRVPVRSVPASTTQQFTQHGAMDVGQATLDSVVEEREAFVIEPQ